MKIKYPVYQPNLSGNEEKYVMDCLKSTWISSKGKYINKFESKFSEFINVNHSVTVSNGTVALHLALLALGVGAGDEVIVPSFTYIASVNAITYTGATPIFVDSESKYWQMDIKEVEQKVTNRTRAILCVHLYGHPCDMQELVRIKNKYNLFLIEDCAEAIGSKYQDYTVGQFGDFSTFSFYGNKTITTGEGGMVCTNDHTLYERCTHLKTQGLAKYREYWHDIIGYNYRMTNICASIGLAQLERIEELLLKKRKLAETYKRLLENTGYTYQLERNDSFHSYWMFTMLVKNADDREPIRKHLREKGIETRPAFYPVHTMPMYSHKFERLKVAEDLGWRGINLPSYPDLTIKDIEYIVDSIKDFER